MKKTFLKLVTLVTICTTSTVFAQVGVGVPAGDIHPSAELEVKSSTKGFLPPRMTKAQRLAMIAQGSTTFPAAGLLVFQTDGDANEPTGLYFFDGTAWRNGAGVVGAKGDKGDKGETGAQGLQGQVGAQGPKGDTGLKGDTGETGAQGLQGLPGVNGLPGATGSRGDKGDKGDTGATGPAGADGAVGATGPAGADGQVSVTTAGSGINVTGAGTAASPYVVSTTNPCGLAIGQTYQGGIIFYLDASGCHGLISAPTDQSTGIKWDNGIFTNTQAFASCVGCGDGNTSMIVYDQGLDSYAAKLCFDLSLGGYSDWYLPSKYELNLMYRNIGQGNALGLGNVGGFANNRYWSSTEYDNNYAWIQFFDNGNQGGTNKNFFNLVRSVRAF